jgi:hypothetical protein
VRFRVFPKLTTTVVGPKSALAQPLRREVSLILTGLNDIETFGLRYLAPSIWTTKLGNDLKVGAGE